MSAVDLLLRAAALMRTRAEGAAAGPWEAVSDGRSTEVLADDGADVIYRRVMDMQAPADAEHIASWHPVVALAVADWLDAHAAVHEVYDPRAVAVARAYLGES